MTINNIITQYLSENKRLVVPNLGAFIRKDRADVVFVEFLKKDDQVLTSLVRKECGVREEQAQAIVEKFVSDIKHSVLLLGVGYTIEGLGTINADETGTFSLLYNPDVKKNGEDSNIEIEKKEHARGAEVKTHPTLSKTTSAGGVEKIIGGSASQSKGTGRQADVVSGKTDEGNAGLKEPATNEKAKASPHPSNRESQKVEQRQASPHRSTQADRSRETVESRGAQVENRAQQPQRQRQRPSGQGGGKRGKRADIIVIVAIVAALIAIASVVFGIFTNVNPVDSMKTTAPQNQQVKVETVDSLVLEKPKTE